MDFNISPIAAGPPGAPAALAARGPDPLLDIPAHSPLRRVAGLQLVVPPNVIVAVGTCLRASTVESLVGSAVFVGPPSAPTTAHGLCPVIVGVLPSKYEAILVQLEAEPPGVGLVAGASYASPEDFASAIESAVLRLNTNLLHAAYLLTAADTYALEPIALGAPANFGQLAAGATAVTFGSLTDARGFTSHFGLFSFVCFGRHLSFSRDAPGQPTRLFFQTLGGLCGIVGFQRAAAVGASVTCAALGLWLEATRPTISVSFLYETGMGLDRREQVVRDRHNLVFGTVEQKELVMGRLALLAPVRAMTPQFQSILGPTPSVTEAIDALRQLSRAFTRSETSVTTFGQLFSLERAYRLAAQAALAAPGLTTMHARLDAVIRGASGFAPSSASGPSAGAAPGAPSSSATDIYDSDIAAAFAQQAWQTFEAQLSALCVPAAVGASVNQALIFHKLMASPILGVRQLTLGKNSAHLDKIKRLSPTVVRAIDCLQDFHQIAAQTLVAQSTVTFDLVTPDEISFHRVLSKSVTKSLLNMQLSDLDIIKDLLLPVEQARLGANVPAAPYPGGIYDASAAVTLPDLLNRVALLLGLPSVLPNAAPVGFMLLSSIATTAQIEMRGLERRQDAFLEDNLVNLHHFVEFAWGDVSTLLHDHYHLQRNPAGPVPTSALPQTSSAMAALSRLQQDMAGQLVTAKQTPMLHRMLSEYAGGSFGRGGSSGRPRSSSQDGRPSPSAGAVDQRGRPLSRNSSRSSRSPSAGRSPSGERSDDMRGATYKDIVCHSKDGSAFWYQRPSNQERVSPVFDYATLERLAGPGHTRHTLDFPYLLSIKTGAARLAMCCNPAAHTGGASDPAHTEPYSGFIKAVRQHFGQPAAKTGRASPPANPPSSSSKRKARST